MISAENVRRALYARFGSLLTADPGFVEGAASLLSSYASWRESFAALARRMEEYLFNAVYERTGPGMTYPMGDGTVRRLLMSDLPAAADEALFPLFAALVPSPAHLQQLRAYWMDSGSLSALRVLSLNYQPYLSPEEYRLIERVARENIGTAPAPADPQRKEEKYP